MGGLEWTWIWVGDDDIGEKTMESMVKRVMKKNKNIIHVQGQGKLEFEQ